MSITKQMAYPPSQFDENERQSALQDAYAVIDTKFQNHAIEAHIPGVAYGIIAGGRLVHTGSFGVRNVMTGLPVDSNTVFRIASMTKSFTAAAILNLRDGGHLRLDEPAATYVPEMAGWRYPTVDSVPITVRQLLTMNAGLPQDDPWADRQVYRSDAAMSELYAMGTSWSNPPGICFEYSNYGYMLLGRIITNVAGTPAVDYINRELLEPLGMDATAWDAAAVVPEQLANGYRWEDAQWKEEELLPCGGDVATFAGIFTSVQDLARWVAFLLDAWPPRDEPDHGPLRRSSRREMQQISTAVTPALTTNADGTPRLVSGGYGFGLSIGHDGHWRSVGHGGGLPGFGSHMRWLPEYDLGLVALGNVTYARLHRLTGDLLNELVSLATLTPRQVPTTTVLEKAQAGIIQLIDGWNDELADTLFADNVLLDSDAAHRQKALAKLRERHGPLQPKGALQAENWLRGTWRMVGETGWVDMSITLNPTVPPQVQQWSWQSSLDEK